MDEFIKLFEEYRKDRNISLSMEQVQSGISRWRIQAFEHNVVPEPYTGDRQVLFAEDADKQICIEKAIRALKLMQEIEKRRTERVYKAWR